MAKCKIYRFEEQDTTVNTKKLQGILHLDTPSFLTKDVCKTETTWLTLCFALYRLA